VPVPQISPAELCVHLSQPVGRPLLLDVRTPAEHQQVALPGSLLIPLHELEERVEELSAHRDEQLVVYCHLGVRSQAAAAYLCTLGFNARSLTGGIDLYAAQVDPSLPRY
jgi:rhodanese-related sulfurtransferase